jgi:hypothetical protein
MQKSSPHLSLQLKHIVVACALLAGTGFAQAVALEGFEAPILAPQGVASYPTGSSWRFSGGAGAGIQRNGHIPSAPSAPDGRQTAFLKGGGSKMSIPVFLDKGEYQISFYAAKGSQDFGGPVQVKVNGQPIGNAITPTEGTFQKHTTTAFPLGTPNNYTIELSIPTSTPAGNISLIDAVSVTRLGTQEPVVIKIMPNDAEGTIRSDIGPWTYGSGIESTRAELRMTMNDYNSAAPTGRQETAKSIMNLRLGTLRFPNGDSSFEYVWHYPDGSLKETTSGNETTKQLTPDEIIQYTQACLPVASQTCRPQLNMDRLFQVNTAFWRDFDNKWQLNYVDSNFHTNPRQAPALNPDNLDKAAKYAARWVAEDLKKPLGSTNLWEVGNEDWSRWKPQDYADIFFAFQKEMRPKRADLRLLAQGLGADFTTFFGTNTPENWLSALKNKLETNGAADSVYAYSIHKYMKAGLYSGSANEEERRQRQTQEMLGLVATGEPVGKVKSLLNSSPSTAKWKVWVTEFNVAQPTGKLIDGKPEAANLQDMGHALVIADWTGKMLEQNVERMFMHSLDHNPSWAIVAYANLVGVKLETPRVMVPGYAYSRYAQEFGNIMTRNTAVNNAPVSIDDDRGNKLSYPQVGVYSSITSDKKSLRVMVINRHMTQPADVTINALNVPGFKLPNAQYGVRSLKGPNVSTRLSASNKDQKDFVKWTDWSWAQQSATSGTPVIRLEPASVNLFIMPIDSQL